MMKVFSAAFIHSRLRNVILLSGIICLLTCGCTEGADAPTGSADNNDNVLNLEYASQFSAAMDDGCYRLEIADGRKYLLIPEEISEDDKSLNEKYGDYIRINIPVSTVYLAASSAMDMFRELDALDEVYLTSTNEWAIDGINERLSDGRMYYIGKYMAPDYEALLEAQCDLALESTMIYHSPATAEEIEALNIPVLIERSSYENDPLARLEWIKLYGLLTGHEQEAIAFFDEVKKEVLNIVSKTEESKGKRPDTAFFSISQNGYATVRKPQDYVAKMISMAGGNYVPQDISPDEKATATMNIQMEVFVTEVSNADILIYNSTIRSGPKSIDELTEMSDVFLDFSAVKSKNVWCTSRSMFQETTAVSRIITELNQIISGDYDEDNMEYFYKLK